ncbi:MAG: FkbM family methyltransferase [Thaumarchaeota archaeon]|nr:FkbM family methyltransferase [Nitrososphaerota archaeon]
MDRGWKYLLKDPKLIFRLRARLAYAATLEEVFIQQPYLWLFNKIKPKTTLLDIGAFIGDSAIYFGQSNKVNNILSFEPIKSSYNEALKNIDKSPFKGKIKIYNAAVSNFKGKITVPSKGFGHTKLNDKAEHSVNVIDLNSITKGIKNIAIKCDVEGMEIEIFKNANLKNVYAIQIEYHDTRELLTSILKSKGFKINIKDRRSDALYDDIGYVCAERIN